MGSRDDGAERALSRMLEAGLFASVVAHEVNNYLAPALLHIDFMKGSALPDDARKSLAQVERVLGKAVKALSSLHSANRTTDVLPSSELRAKDLMTSLGEACKDMFPAEWPCKFEPASPELVFHAVPADLARALIDVFAATRELAPDSGGVIVRMVPRGSESAVIEVEDYCGEARNDYKSILAALVRAPGEAADKRAEKVAGLRLGSVVRAVRGLGSIEVESSKKAGGVPGHILRIILPTRRGELI